MNLFFIVLFLATNLTSFFIISFHSIPFCDVFSCSCSPWPLTPLTTDIKLCWLSSCPYPLRCVHLSPAGRVLQISICVPAAEVCLWSSVKSGGVECVLLPRMTWQQRYLITLNPAFQQTGCRVMNVDLHLQPFTLQGLKEKKKLRTKRLGLLQCSPPSNFRLEFLQLELEINRSVSRLPRNHSCTWPSSLNQRFSHVIKSPLQSLEAKHYHFTSKRSRKNRFQNQISYDIMSDSIVLFLDSKLQVQVHTENWEPLS